MCDTSSSDTVTTTPTVCDTPLISMTTSYQEESENVNLSGRVLGSSEFWYYASKTKISMDRLNETLNKAALLLKLGGSVKELKAEMNKFRAEIDRLAETNDLSELATSEFSST